jgi:hypothetical protein
MPEEDSRPVGLNREAGWQIGVRKPLSVPRTEVWHLLTSPTGLRIWLGPVPGLDQAKGVTCQLENVTRGEQRLVVPHSN